ncbi:MAG: hypothetical protein Q7R90_00465 [bacterium]|nr:hypothetical protein [bacterium]
MSNWSTSLTSGSKQIWYVIGALAIVLLIGWAVMNSSGSTGSIFGNTDTPAATTATTTDTAGTGGTATGAGKYPAGWPADAPALQSGAKITYSGAIDPETKIVGPMLIYTTSSTPATAVTFFKSQFTAKGWTFRGQGNVQGSVQLAATKDTRRVTVTILETRTGVLNVTVGISKQ